MIDLIFWERRRAKIFMAIYISRASAPFKLRFPILFLNALTAFTTSAQRITVGYLHTNVVRQNGMVTVEAVD
jgi:hypothetical protein